MLYEGHLYTILHLKTLMKVQAPKIQISTIDAARRDPTILHFIPLEGFHKISKNVSLRSAGRVDHQGICAEGIQMTLTIL